MKSRSLFVVVGITLAAACANLTAPAHAQVVPTTVSSVSSVSSPAAEPVAARRTSGSYARAAKRAVNRQRHRHHRHKLRVEACLLAHAQQRAAVMARTGRLQHAALAPIQSACGLRRMGENIAYGYGTGRAVVNRGWMHSASHRSTLLSKRYRKIAVGAAQDAHGVWYVSLLVGKG